MIALALLACVGRGDLPDDPRVLPELRPPEIGELTLACDPDEAEWQLDVEATSWTAGADLYWTVDGDYVEQHFVRSVSAEPDGSGDTLRLTLSLAADWRDASSGSSTAFGCSEEPAWRLVVYDTQGEITDCRAAGDAALWAEADVPACEPL